MTDDIYMRESSGNIILEGRAHLSLSGVTDVESFDEREILADTCEGPLLVTGDELHVERLSLDTGELVITGRIGGMEYIGDRSRKGSLWSKLF